MNSSHDAAINSLKRRFSDAKSLIICDPYILRPRGDRSQYMKDICAIIPRSLRQLVFICPHDLVDGEFFARLQQQLEIRLPTLTVRHISDSYIHDRVWVIDQSRAIMTGTSLNSIGKRLSFINDMEQEDFNAFWLHLSNALPEITSH